MNNIPSSRWCAAALLTGSLLTAFGCDSTHAPDDELATLDQPIQNGTVDNGDKHPYVVSILLPGSSCSGILVSPFWVVTAAHCFKDDDGNLVNLNVPLSVIVDVAPETATNDRIFGHSPTTSPINLRSLAPFSFVDDDEVSRDIAAFRLDTRVPRSLARPRPVPIVPGQCGNDFDGDIVGYGRTGLLESCSDQSLRRRFNELDWSRSSEDFGDIFDHTYIFTLFNLPLICNIYDGAQEGDSGGALIRNDNGMLCGVGSAIHSFPVGGTVFVRNKYAALDSAETIDWLENDLLSSVSSGLIDPKGNFEGECPAYLQQCDALGDAHCDMLESQDADSDGIIDVCDNCPNDFNPEQMQGNGDDLEPAAGQQYPGDGFGAVCDNCPDTWNPSQMDRDDDGIGDSCDKCPLDPDPTHQDNDGDGRCELMDNCPATFNPGQENCNVVSELEHTPDQVWGDACDPVPCPDQTGKAYGGGVLSRFQNDRFFFETSLRLNDRLEIKPLRSHPAEGSGGVPFGFGNVDTLARFCQRDLELGHTCDSSFDIQDARLFDAACAPTLSDPTPCEDVEQASDPFHRMQFSSGGNGSNPNGNPAALDYVFPPASSTAGIQWVWDYEADIERWKAAGFFSDPPDDGAREVFDGTLWLHADTRVGAVEGPNGFHGRFLSNHHDLRFKPADVVARVGTNFRAVQNPFFLLLTLPDPGPDDYRRWDSVLGETSIIVPAGEEIGALDLNGDVQVLSDNVGPSLRASMADESVVWASSTEPFLEMGDDEEFPMAVGLSSNGSQLVESVVTRGSTLLGLGDRKAAPPKFTGSPNATGFVALLSQASHGVFVVGGDDPKTNRPTGEIWFHDLTDGPWRLVVGDVTVGNVLASTFNFATGELFVLDEISKRKLHRRHRYGHKHHKKVRLFAIDPTTGETRVLGTWRRTGLWDQHWLVTDRDGSLLLASSKDSGCRYRTRWCRSRPGRHAIARLDVSGKRPRVTGIDFGRRSLAFAPVVDAAGYTVVTKRRDDRVKVRRTDRLVRDVRRRSMKKLSQQL